jgi:outer membrane lipoprotein-sorting protein
MKSPLTRPGMVLLLVCGLTGCYKTVRTVQQTQAPDVYRSASVEQLEKMVSDRDAAIKTLKANVLLTASTGGGSTGKVTQYTSLKGYIFVSKPSQLRVILLVPVLGSEALDMVSNADNFTLMYKSPSKGDVWRQGSNKVTTPSKNALENLRPPVFFDSLLVPGIEPDDYVALPESTRLIQPTKRGKPAIEEPDYDLVVEHQKADHVMQIKRVLHISRVDMLPYAQDTYDDNGRVVTSAEYEQYKNFNGVQFPSLITIKRPLDELALKIQIVSLDLNQTFEEDQFQLTPPPGVKVEQMH